MKRIPIQPDFSQFPDIFYQLLTSNPVYDSSCSKEARVYYIESDGGLFLKTAPKGALQTEAAMTRYFHSKGLGAEVLAYLSENCDWLLSRQIPGEDCTHSLYTANPRQLCDTTAALLRQLHEIDFTDCPVANRNETYRITAAQNYQKGIFEPELFPVHWHFGSREDAWQEVTQNGKHLTGNVLLHGDYCLPNILLKDWHFSGFIDLDCAGVGDRHIDLLWGCWTLFFNLKTDAYFDRFLDAYGRDVIQPEKLRTVAAFEIFR